MEITKNKKNKSFLFRIGKGGRLNYPGYRYFKGVINEFNAERFDINFVYTFKNLDNFLKASGCNSLYNFEKKYNVDLAYIACFWNEKTKEDFNKIKIVDELTSNKNYKHYLTADDLGENVILLENGRIACTVSQFQSERGYFNVKDNYEYYYWRGLNDLNSREVKIIANSSKRYKKEVNNAISEVYLDDNISKLVTFLLYNSNSEINFRKTEKLSFKDFLKKYNVKVFQNIEEAEKKSVRTCKIDGKYYGFN